MNLQELINELRIALADEVEPCLWSDEALTSYLNEAVQEACERALLIEDMTTEAVCRIALQPGQAVYRLHPSVLKVERALVDGKPLTETSIERLDEGMTNWEARRGEPRQYVFVQAGGAGQPAIQLVPEPVAPGLLKLRVYRGALVPMAEAAAETDAPEIPVRHHRKLMNWALRCAYLRPDADGYDRDRAQLHEAMFERDFGARPDANVQRKQRDKRPRLVRSHW